MYDTARRMGFPLMAGSSLPVTWRTPSLEMPLGARIREAVCVCYGGVDSYDFHGLETLQCMVERRQGGETGVKWLQAYRGDAVWKAHADGVWSKDLVEAALCRSHTLPVKDGYPTAAISFDWARRTFPEAFAYFIEHRDGFRTTLFMLPIRDFNYAGLDGESGAITSCQMYLPMPGAGATQA